MQSNIERKQGLEKFDASDFLNSPEECATYLQEFLNEEEDEALLFSAIGDVLKAHRRMTLAAKELGVTREGLYKSFSENGNPSFHTVSHTLRLLGLGLTIHPLDSKEFPVEA